MSSKKKIFISAGDPSGDIHAANLMRSLLRLDSDIEFIGIGGPEMESVGFSSLAKLKDISVVGFWEVAKRYRYFKELERKTQDIIKNNDIKLFLPVDYPGFNLRQASFCREINIPVCYYIAPQLWAWGAKRVKKIKGNVDKLLVVLPFEEKFFKDAGINTTYVGHPLLDQDLFKNPKELKKEYVGFVPGSRTQEVQKHLNIYEKVFNKIDTNKIAISKAKNVSDIHYKSLHNFNNLHIFNDSREMLSKSKVAIVKTGTSTLESALLLTPFVMIYKTSALSYLIGKQLVNIEHLSLPNILLQKQVVTELIQKDCNAKQISAEVNKLLNNSNLYEKQLDSFRKVRSLLDEGSASDNSANIILRMID